MENSSFSPCSLASLLAPRLVELDQIVKRYMSSSVQIKDDGTPVTQLDLALSEFFEQLLSQSYRDSVFYSEESYSRWGFPMLALDPLDGTREFIEGNPQWAISLGHLTEVFAGEGWIYNPLTKELFTSATSRPFVRKEIYRGEVSRSEWKTGLFTNIQSSRAVVSPVGSIAYKLGRLSQGISDFVVSLQPKSIWDIAAGTILCQQAGLTFYSQGQKVAKVQKRFTPPLIWCHEELYEEISSTFGENYTSP